MLWDLTSDNVNSIINSWSVSIRQMWNLPRDSHRIFIEPLGGVHAKTMLFTRFLKFIQSIMKGKKAAHIYLLELIKNNTQTVTGRNIRLILNETRKVNIEKVTVDDLRQCIKLRMLPEEEEWKVVYIKELTNINQSKLTLCSENGEDFFSRKEIDFLISDLSRF